MEWMNRGNRPAQAGHPAATTGSPAGSAPVAAMENKSGFMKWFVVALLFTGAALGMAVILMLIFGGSKTSNQGQYVDSKKMQAVFLNGGQVYFGNITNTNDKFMRMSNIYYLRVNQQVQPNGNSSSNQDISLVKLGCELHGPDDQMVINQDQVIFWENLKTDGQVAKAVAEYVKQNPNGQKCTTDNASSTGNNTTNTTTNNSNTTTKKP